MFTLRQRRLVIICAFALCGVGNNAIQAEQKNIGPGDTIDFESLAFFPDRWRKQNIDFEMVPWQGEEVTFLTTSPDFDHQVMAELLNRLDRGWRLYAKLTGDKPRPYKQLNGKATIAAVPNGSLTCGYGCGMVGRTGIEVSAFYSKDYQDISHNPDALGDYYFYEMGRNYFTFGDRHSQFTTGFAVFMRYVCVDDLELVTNEGLRRTIERAEELHTESDMPFLRAFTTADGLSEKQDRLKDENGRQISPTDQPVMYASAMLRLRRDYGGDKWVERFFAQLNRCPNVRRDRGNSSQKPQAQRQAINWLVTASCAAAEDLTPVFADQWRMEITADQRRIMDQTDWQAETIDASNIVDLLNAN